MRVLVIGSGAREHALVWKLAQSPRVARVYAAPGNPGMMPHAECIPISAEDVVALANFVERNRIDYTVVGPEAPLIDGIVDIFEQRGLRVFGPDKAGAAIEGSKAFAKELMSEAGIPTAQHRSFTDYEQAKAYLEAHGAPVVVKADGNAAGKGAIVALDMQTAQEALADMMVRRVFGAAGDIVVIEDYLQGDEVSITAICNGEDYVLLKFSQDHKRAFDNDEGLNTGGMGVYLPLPFVSEEQAQQVEERIVKATLRALKQRNITYKGVLYSNMMLTENGPMVLEHNARFGDPETQAFMILMKADLLDVLEGKQVTPEELWHPGFAVSLTLASGGYPGKYQNGLPISGIEEANQLDGVQVFHAGTKLDGGQLVTAGGRVLSVAARGETLEEAVTKAYEAAKLISFEGMHYRRDIAHRALRGR
ncbi:phosphoribosylamine--glycine ligase [Thermosporothrix hazakensis]|uniref:Phosphoribosylamine--glycine ligase n=2 Tax=Thermosporothrix TaxID=768650 RepID=A0A326U1D1_THEHA|nr:phosphoribosylamine--glycine ligase [Thermosporothrix hazakensis]PZW23431.1 phosphoribosylamine--glycine ligase [Thermosporothrix hazakensis]BBH89777.1 phosphoribosylamine--glycine ligase [Thermosporothrix sp. COM3]GCE47966.1 phosphoribosylamine--glycine ligase [Thermosporothrix hazakensis]